MKTKVMMTTMLLLVVSSTSVFAQNKFKPLIERIALLQAYLEYLQKGYSIAKNGWETVRKITKGEFDLHADYFNSLESVNPEIKKYASVGSIITIQLRMVKTYKEAYRYAKDCEQFTPDEMGYLSGVFENLLAQAAKDIELLTVVITSNKVKMEDKERLAWIDRIHEDMKDKEKFLYTFNGEMYGLARTRSGESYDIKMLQKINQP